MNEYHNPHDIVKLDVDNDLIVTKLQNLQSDPCVETKGEITPVPPRYLSSATNKI
jgi:hypothetical protein